MEDMDSRRRSGSDSARRDRRVACSTPRRAAALRSTSRAVTAQLPVSNIHVRKSAATDAQNHRPKRRGLSRDPALEVDAQTLVDLYRRTG